MKTTDPFRTYRAQKTHQRSRGNASSEIIYGRNPVMEALSSGSRTFHEIIVLPQHQEELTRAAKGIPVRTAQREDLEKIALSRNHQGVTARVSPYRYAALDDLMGLDTLVLLDSVEDPQNLGSIIRTAYALAGAGVIIPEHRAASVTPAVVKASSGATEHTRIALVQNLKDACREVKKHGFWLVGLDVTAKEDLRGIPGFDKVGIVLGGEDSGIRPIIAREIDLVARIPMKGDFNSLNVSQACTIALYELTGRNRP